MPRKHNVVIRLRWIWGGRAHFTNTKSGLSISRNPLALDMGWKRGMYVNKFRGEFKSQSAYAGYGVEESSASSKGEKEVRHNPLALDMVWKR